MGIKRSVEIHVLKPQPEALGSLLDGANKAGIKVEEQTNAGFRAHSSHPSSSRCAADIRVDLSAATEEHKYSNDQRRHGGHGTLPYRRRPSRRLPARLEA